MKKKIVPYKGKDWTWNHIIVEGYCFYDSSKIPPIKGCKGQISEACLGDKPNPRCPNLGYCAVNKKERKIMLEALFREWDKKSEEDTTVLPS